MDLTQLRRSYALQTLEKTAVNENPVPQFRHWFQQALDGQITEPNAMTLATVSAKGRPSARIVLLKSFDENGFVFFTNYESRKGNDMQANATAALLFCWLDLERQIRIEGSIEKIARQESEAYFISRPKGSQIGAWASPQSQPIADRSVLEEKQTELEVQYANDPVLPLPPHWGGYLLRPDFFEFWQGRESRLHDRIAYYKEENNWRIERLAP